MPVPSTPSIDTFNRADENPAVGWTTWGGVASGVKVLSNKLTSVAASPAYGGSYKPTVYSGGNVEFHFQIGPAPTVGWIEEYYYLIADSGAQSPIRESFRNGYRLLTSFPAANQVQVQRIAGGGTSIGTPGAWTFAADDWIWIQVTGGVHRIYAKTSAAVDYTLVTTFTDTTYTEGVFGYTSQAGGAAQPGTIDSFGGGLLAQQILRPDADVTTTGWATAPLWSKLEEAVAAGDVVTATAS